jgi:hypothetical protein
MPAAYRLSSLTQALALGRAFGYQAGIFAKGVAR